jgi:hypothetical protein
MEHHQKNNLIIWEKWRDPFLGYDENEIDIDNDISDNFYHDEDDLEDHETDESVGSVSKPVRVVYTPMGIVPYNEYTASSSIFNFWVGHTNFNISPSLGVLIEEADGVETLDIFTRYRFRIGIGKAFKDINVMKNIEQQITNNGL